jgi:hypothetical protein
VKPTGDNRRHRPGAPDPAIPALVPAQPELLFVMNLLADPSCEVRHRGRRFAARATISDDDPGDLAIGIFRARPFYTKLIYLAIGERVHNARDVRRLSEGAVPVFLEETPRRLRPR